MSLKKKSTLIIIVVIILFFLFDYFQPHPSRKLVIAAGAKSGQYYRLANQLKNELSKNGIELEILVTKGSIDNLQLLNNKEKKVDIALVQSGTADSIDYPKIQSIAGLFYEPLWLVYRPQAFVNLRRPPDLIQDLKLKKVSLGVNGSGTLKLVKQIFDLEKIDVSQSNFFYLATDESLSKLQNGEIDAMFLSVNNHAQIMQTIFEDPSLKIMSFAKAYGYASKIKGMRVLNLPRATLDIVYDKPDREIFILSSTAELVATKDIHPAITSLLVDVLDDFLFKADILSNEKTFPSANNLSFDINEAAQETIKHGPSFLHRHLPFWFAVWVDHIIRYLIPIIAILIPIFQFLPMMDFLIKLKLAKFYDDLKKIEVGINDGQLDKNQAMQKIDKTLDINLKLKVSHLENKDIFD